MRDTLERQLAAFLRKKRGDMTFFDHAAALADIHGVEVYHETHRSRALFCLPATMEILAARPKLKLVADFSHWCCVHETLLADQPERLERAMHNAHAIHGRIGFPEGPQIPDPRNPIWQPTMDVFLSWWKRIAELRRAEGCVMLPVTPEFGPAPYMTVLPHTHKPIADLWEVNCFMRDWLQQSL